MKLQTFVDILRGGNLALGSKLSNLLTEDCTILEYTNDSVLFSKGHKLVLATFKNPLTESKMTSSNILENEVIEISKVELTETMKNTLNKVVECVISENLVDGQEYLDEFCQTFYQTAILRNRYPEVFVEELIKKSEGRAIRMEARLLISEFKAAVFNAAVMTESADDEDVITANLVAVVESKLGKVLNLGKVKVKEIIADALLGNTLLSESITENLYIILEGLEDNSHRENRYDAGAGKFSDEDQSELDREDEEIPSVPTEKDNINDEDEAKEFAPFNPAMFSEDDIKQLHKTTLKSILLAMQDFVHDKASDSEDTQVDPDLAEQINADLLALEDGEELGDDRLAEIEARWNPMISYFLDSSYHTPTEELEGAEEDQPLEDQLPPEGSTESTPIENVDQGQAGAPAPAMPAPQAPGQPVV
jgi:hypothetical protein